MKQFVGYFSKVTKVTLADTFNIPCHLLATSLNRIIHLRQLSKLTINSLNIPFDEVVELLHFTPNIHTLELDSISIPGTDSLSIQQNEKFRLISNINTVTNMTIGKESALEQVQLLDALFPRLEHLTINLYKEDLESIVRFLLSASTNNTCHLSMLCILSQVTDSMESLRNLIESEQILQNFTLKTFRDKLCLWW